MLGTALTMLEGGSELPRAVAAEFARRVPAHAEALAAAAYEAAAALAHFKTTLRTELQANPAELSFAVGEDEFNRRLHHEHALRSTAPELWRYGLRLVEEAGAAMQEAALKLSPGVAWAETVRRLRAEGPGTAAARGVRRRGGPSARLPGRIGAGGPDADRTPGGADADAFCSISSPRSGASRRDRRSGAATAGSTWATPTAGRCTHGTRPGPGPPPRRGPVTFCSGRRRRPSGRWCGSTSGRRSRCGAGRCMRRNCWPRRGSRAGRRRG